MKIRIFVSGEMELNALPRLTEKLLNELGQKDYHEVIIRKNVSGKGQFLSKIGLLVKNSFNDKYLKSVISLEDLDNNDLESYKNRFIENVNFDFHSKYFPIFAVREVETWILSDFDLLLNYNLENITKYENPEQEINNVKKPKEYMKELFRINNRKYKETVDGVNLLSNLNIDAVYKKCPSFKYFIGKLLNELGIENKFNTR